MPPKRKSLNERLERLHTEENDDVVMELMDELAEENNAAIGFRYSNKRTQNFQDMVLAQYKKWVGLSLTRGTEATDIECFPNNHEMLFRYTRTFLLYVIREAVPRSLSDTNIQYNQVCKYRRALIFWINRKYGERKVEPPRQALVWNNMTEAIRYGGTKYSLSKRSLVNAKSYVGIAELQLMIDIDTKATPCIELAEGHHFAWCLGRITALRPGSIGRMEKTREPFPLSRGSILPEGPPFLVWKDIQITRTSQPGQFNLDVTIRNVKTNSHDPELMGTHKRLVFHIYAPQQQDNIIFSPALRLIAIGIRRGVFREIKTVQDLFDSQLRLLTVKDEYLSQPIILAGGHRGLTVQQGVACTSAALSEYLQLRGQRAGFPQSITFYSIRRRSGTDLALAFGADVARELMAHEPDSRTLERFYLDTNRIRDLSAVALREDQEARIEENRQLGNTLALHRLDPKEIVSTYGHVLNALVRQMVASDADYPLEGSLKEKKNYDRRIRRAAMQTVVQKAHEERVAKQTIAEFEQRRMGLDEASEFSKAVVRAAREKMLTATQDGVDTDATNYDDEFPEANQDEPPEGDAENATAGRDQVEVRVETDDAATDGPDETGVTYEWSCRMFLEILLEHSLGTYAPNREFECDLCYNDETIETVFKTSNKANLLRHQNQGTHFPDAKFRRQSHLDQAMHPDQKFTCPYCAAVVPEDGVVSSWAKYVSLVDHINKSSPSRIAGSETWMADEELCQLHDYKKVEAGWYEANWEGDPVWRAEERRKDARSRAAASGIEYSSVQELTGPVPHPTRAGIVLGCFEKFVIPDRFRHLMTWEDPGITFPIRPLTITTDPEQSGLKDGIPERLRNHIVAVNLDELEQSAKRRK